MFTSFKYVIRATFFFSLFQYKADVSKVKELLTIPQYFDLELYAEKRLTKVGRVVAC